MSLLNHCATSGGQPPSFLLKGTGNHESNHHHPKSLPLHGTHTKKLQNPNSTINRTSPTMTINGEVVSLPEELTKASFMGKQQGIEELSQLLSKNDYNKHSMEFEPFFMGPLVQFDNEPSGEKKVALAVSVSSALKLDERQVSLIARKMKRLTGFTNLKLENIIDPTLIAGFVISYGDDGSNVIDLSVKGQLANLASRADDFDKWIPSHDER
ncbi:ATP synthase subunit delta, chloroplastic-like [Phalaenopsis equestris]|uniref:ATP synthase subunit delta, chloroplastic-like n=1 Tax=Phalaenopsis equestris TaxID=78828 RepID=UPI0009E218CC|nr:ATP synthase subunit delta, chloroplastic-like [Phalaenopsis equestris]